MIVAALEHGRTAEEAGRRALEDVLTLDTGGATSSMATVVLASDGTHAGLSTEPDKEYVYWESGMTTYATAPRIVVRA
jgi:hypothetical protein